MLIYRFSYKAYAKNVKEKATKCSLNNIVVLLDADGNVLTYVWYFPRYSSSRLF